MRSATQLQQKAGPVQPHLAPTTARKTQVLLVEDDTAVRTALRRVLEYHGYTVVDAATGSAAVAMSRDVGFRADVVLTDVILPDMSGNELVETLTRDGRLWRVLMMSGYPDEVLVERGTPPNGCELIRKPFGPSELASRMSEILDGSVSP